MLVPELSRWVKRNIPHQDPLVSGRNPQPAPAQPEFLVRHGHCEPQNFFASTPAFARDSPNSVTADANYLRHPLNAVRIWAIAMPVEHGGWALVGEPIVLGLLLGPSAAGVSLAIAILALFLTRQPLKLAMMDWRRHRRSPRTIIAAGFVAVFACLAGLAFLVSLKTSQNIFITPFLVALPLVLIQLYCDATGRSRSLIAELAGSFSIGAVASAIVLASGWNAAAAFGLWTILASRSVPTIFYLRARLRLTRGKSASVPMTILVHLIAAAAILGIAIKHLVPYFAVVALVLLLMRATLGLLTPGRPLKAKQLGVREILYGALTVFSVIIGRAINW